MKPVNWISATGRKPCAASPTDSPAIAFSASGVSRDAIRSEALQQPVRSAEHAALGGNVLAEDEDIGILGHGARERQIDGLDEVDLRHGSFTPAPYRVPSGAAPQDPLAAPRK